MVCLVLAAGYATRLRPLTENYPKPLLCVKGKTILDWLLDDIDATGCVDRTIVVSNHRFVEPFQKWTSNKRLASEVEVLDDGTFTNETRLGAVKDIELAIVNAQPNDDLLIVAGDNLLDFSLAHFIAYAKRKATSCVMRYHERELGKLRQAGVASIDEKERVIRMEEKPAEPFANWCLPPFYFYRREDLPWILKAVQSGCGTDAPGSLVAWLYTVIPIHAMEMPGRRYDIGDIVSYRAACEQYQGITIDILR